MSSQIVPERGFEIRISLDEGYNIPSQFIYIISASHPVLFFSFFSNFFVTFRIFQLLDQYLQDHYHNIFLFFFFIF